MSSSTRMAYRRTAFLRSASQRHRPRASRSPLHCFWLAVGLLAGGCSNILGLDAYTVDAHADGGTHVECTSNQQCTSAASSSDADTGATRIVPSICRKSTGQCIPLTSQDCTTVEGNYVDDNALVVGSLFSTSGSQASTNLPRQRSASLAIDEINRAGGIPVGNTSTGGRPLVLVSCDESVNLMRAGSHLVDDLQVPAIVGPNTSQDTLDLSNKLSIKGGTAVLSPTAVASSIADLADNDLTWQMVPTDVQRAPLMIREIGDLETRLRHDRARDQLRLSVIFRNDALGQGTRQALDDLTFNGAPLSAPVNLGTNVRVDPYMINQPNQQPIIDANVKFAPDIIVLIGTAEAVTDVMVPLEQAWTGSADSRPEYVLIDSSKTPELLTAVTGNSDLRQRVRGTGASSASDSIPVNEAFTVTYATLYPNESADISGMGPSYDAVYAIAFAIASLRGAPVNGTTIAQGLRKLATGGTQVEVESTMILAGFRKLTAGDPLTVVGTFAPLQWNDNGAIMGGTVELWCITETGGKTSYDSSGLTFDLASGKTAGQYTQCAP
jgi:ABC-type branched-subunit amino acid transport system substrate-binding protein